MQKERLNSHIPSRLKRQLKDIATDQKRTVNDVVIDALQNHVNRINHSHSAPDLVLDRMNQLFNIQLQITQQLNRIINQLNE